jgi:signal transduction histidine kinase
MNEKNLGQAHYNKLLARQLRKYLPDAGEQEKLQPLLSAISEAYTTYERDREMIEQAMNLNSEELMSANEDLRKANQELDRFVYSVSHDLRAPIASVLGLLNLIETEPDPNAQDHYHKLMNQSLHRLDNFIHDIIDYSRNSRLDNEAQEICFNELLEEVASGLRYMPNAHYVELIRKLDSSVPFWSDKRRLKMIFSNLIGNAVRYRNPQVKSYVSVTTKVDESQILITIQDNGLGIKEEYHKKIFEMFFRAHEKSEGSGLGLYIVNEAVKKLGGSISVASQVNVGTTFAIRLPNELANSHQGVNQQSLAK